MLNSGFGHILRNVGRYHSRSKKRATLGKGRRLGSSKVRYRSLKETQRKKLVNSTGDDPFDPDDLAEMSARFSGIIKDSDEGYVMEFIISKADAKEMSACWAAAKRGDKLSISLCLGEFGKIVAELEQALKREN
jgi:hypothetical protein